MNLQAFFEEFCEAPGHQRRNELMKVARPYLRKAAKGLPKESRIYCPHCHEALVAASFLGRPSFVWIIRARDGDVAKIRNTLDLDEARTEALISELGPSASDAEARHWLQRNLAGIRRAREILATRSGATGNDVLVELPLGMQLEAACSKCHHRVDIADREDGVRGVMIGVPKSTEWEASWYTEIPPEGVLMDEFPLGRTGERPATP